MLASIHPLGERGRKQRWGVTVSAYLAGSLAGAGLLGAALGQVGAWLHLPGDPSPTAAGLLVAALAVLGLVLDLRVGGVRLPTIHRQVDEEWLQRYRGWVYGVSFGFQLGLGVVTVVNSFTVYLALALALLSGSPALGAVIGLTFGLVRGAGVLAVAGVREPQQLRALLRRLQYLEPASHRLAVAVQAVVAVTGLTLIGR
jgi:hypothetical protein